MLKRGKEGDRGVNFNKRGFTLIELLIVCIIITLLLGAGLPYFRSIQTEGTKTKVRSNLETLKKAVEGYAASPRSNGTGKYPDGTDLGNQTNWFGSRTAGSGWQTNHLMVGYNALAMPLGTTGTIISSTELLDQFSPAGVNVEYGYYVNTQGYYVIWSNGTNMVNINCLVSPTGVVTAPGSAMYVTNGQ